MKFVDLDPGMVFVAITNSKNGAYVVFIRDVDATYVHYDIFENDNGKVRWNLDGKLDSERWNQAMLSSFVRPSALDGLQHRKIIQGLFR